MSAISIQKTKHLQLIKPEQVPTQAHAPTPKSIFIKDQGITRRYSADDIIMIEADSNYSIIHTTGGRRIHTSKTLKVWQEILKEAIDFAKPHRSYIVNHNHIQGYQSQPRTLILTGNVEIPIARRFNLKQLKP
jgi:DNA-binding LytR/AlgR family response regulator